VQSEFYTKPDPEKRKVDGVPLYVLDGERVRAKAPTYTVFNGRYNGMVDKPLDAKPGERVRPVRAQRRPVEHVELPRRRHDLRPRVGGRQSGQPDARDADGPARLVVGSDHRVHRARGCSYVMVDHHFANASQGAIGLIKAGGKSEEGAADTEHHNIPATAAPTDLLAVRGKLSFESKCLACHSIAGGDKLGRISTR
jgi:nitrite reductase (NO-forming)